MTLFPTACLVISVRLLSRHVCAMNTKVKRNKRKYTCTRGSQNKRSVVTLTPNCVVQAEKSTAGEAEASSGAPLAAWSMATRPDSSSRLP